jgi:RimJ/RimL family protein N-acetyltransferase
VLEVKAHNARAINLYRHLGFAAVGRRARFYADGADALLMARPPPSSLLASPDTEPPTSSASPPAD